KEAVGAAHDARRLERRPVGREARLDEGHALGGLDDGEVPTAVAERLPVDDLAVGVHALHGRARGAHADARRLVLADGRRRAARGQREDQGASTSCSRGSLSKTFLANGHSATILCPFARAQSTAAWTSFCPAPWPRSSGPISVC